ncbi:L-serine ammonia-lyase, iron-sulfur-dependent, subunit alpha [Pseudobutyrivibrio ruminis]|uniref:L-serine dehydratase n=1 Tax=Pseudobutyrivibrio ruminis DSM 9787 TaxID=1123011 RepID=A0A285RSL0_9FIRM|nr:L-serine ammonia-lyase, iron-sulfur-dependent, subunit alpha [Pseudobutyrivibrio ruminis]SOB97197.1 L-serine dehydratase [Pseudobutyrivibrio ruminis DSM 9787]
MFDSVEEICKLEENSGVPFWKIVQQDDCKERAVSEEESFENMKRMYTAMKESALNYDKTVKSNSGLVGGEAGLLREYLDGGNALVGDFAGRVMELALRVAEGNACMKRIVAAPTAGSCGVVPAVFIATQEKLGLSDDKMTEALFVAAGFGEVIAARASLAGAEGGCQAEIGAASSMAAAGLVYLRGGSGRNSANAAALALKNLLGLACDPVAGLVEVPCVKRNVCGAMNAVTSAELTMAGIESRIPADEVFDAMSAVGKDMNPNIKETGKGGVAGTATGQKIKDALVH